MTTPRFAGLLFLVFLLGLAIRLPGVWWGFHETPHSYYHPDEDRIGRMTVNIATHGKSEDYYPDGYSSLLALYFAHHDPLPAHWKDTVLAARLLSVAHSAATIGVIAWLALLLGLGTSGALVAAAGYAFAGVATVHGHFGVTDAALVFWLTLTMAVALALKRRPWLAVIASAFTGGLALCVKMAWPALLPSLVTVFRAKRRWLAFPLSLGVSFLTFRFFDYEYTWSDFIKLRSMVAIENMHAVRGHTYYWNPVVLAILLLVGVGLPLAVLAIRGMVAVGNEKRKYCSFDWLVVWAPTSGYVLNFLMVSVLFPRHVLPILPALCLMMAVGWNGWRWIKGRSRNVVWTVIAVWGMYQGAYLYTIERAYWRDTRQGMDDWLQRTPSLSGARIHGPTYIQLHAWQAMPPSSRLEKSTHVLIHEGDYWRYLRSPIHPFDRRVPIERVYRRGQHGEFYWSLVRDRTSFKEIHREPWRALTPELMIYKRFWGSFPEFVGDTVLYEKTD